MAKVTVKALEKNSWGKPVITPYGEITPEKGTGNFEMDESKAKALIGSSPNFVDAEEYERQQAEEALKQKKQLLKEKIGELDAADVKDVAEKVLKKNIFTKFKDKGKKVLIAVIISNISEDDIDDTLAALKEEE